MKAEQRQVKIREFRTPVLLPVFDSDFEAACLDGNTGFCIGCAAECEGVEPDARYYPCESCSAKMVFGVEELLMRGWVIGGGTQ